MTNPAPPPVARAALQALRALLAQAELAADLLRRAGEWAAAEEVGVLAEVVDLRLARLAAAPRRAVPRGVS